MQRIKKGDRVVIIAGRDKGKISNVIRLDGERVFVENASMIKRHVKANPQANQPGGIISKESSIHQSNVALYNPQTKKADRVGVKTLEDGNKVRVFRSTGEAVDG